MSVDNRDDIIDSRDIIARIAELEESLSTCEYCQEEITESENGLGYYILADNEPDIATRRHCTSETSPDGDHMPESDSPDDDRAELATLAKFAEEGESFADWPHGITLIRDSYFETYAQDLAEDVSNVKSAAWPFSHIDWEAAADELQQDYTSIDFDGVTYWAQ